MGKKRSIAAAYPADDWEAEEDLRAVIRAKAVQADPERMKKVKALAKEKREEYQRRKEEAQEALSLSTEK